MTPANQNAFQPLQFPETMPKYLAFDLEIYREIPDGAADLLRFRPLGISCAATLSSDGELKQWHGSDEQGGITSQIPVGQLNALVADLMHYHEQGYKIITWNGLGFDFDILFEETGGNHDCKYLALNHYDMMFHLFCDKGYPLSLDKAARGMGLAGKTAGMDGSQAPRLWQQGQFDKVLDYLAQDVKTTMDLCTACESRHKLEWFSKTGRLQRLALQKGWLKVSEALKLPEPDTSWMSDAWPRSKFTAWLDL